MQLISLRGLTLDSTCSKTCQDFDLHGEPMPAKEVLENGLYKITVDKNQSLHTQDKTTPH
jgi:hypothetical protein